MRGIAPLVAPERVYPDFVGIGAQMAGTTWLGHNLQLHPEIWMPGIKELHYFNERINDPKNPISRLYGKVWGKGTVNRRWRRQVRSRLRCHRKRFSREKSSSGISGITPAHPATGGTPSSSSRDGGR